MNFIINVIGSQILKLRLLWGVTIATDHFFSYWRHVPFKLSFVSFDFEQDLEEHLAYVQ